MSSKSPPKPFVPSRAFRRYTGVVIGFTVLLIWWGVATTTTGSGMVFADWPLSLGSVNPDGWLSNLAPFLEHTHRLLANVVGFLTLGLLFWVYGRNGKRAGEVLALLIYLAFVFGIFVASGMETQDADRRNMLLLSGSVAGVLPVVWLAWSWAKRGWTLLEKLAALALLMVTAQAIFGGLRVTEISDSWAVFHGCFAQAFFCVLILIALVAAPGWNQKRPVVGYRTGTKLKTISVVSVVMILIQLGLGAYMRHHHRFGLADTGILRTGGELVPPFNDPMIAVMFLHKITAITILVMALSFFGWLMLQRNTATRFVRGQLVVVGLLLAQVILGIFVIVTGKSFWITNFHVLNGLGILALAFTIAVWALRSKNETLIAADSR